jgi:hypothetical protein
MRKPKEEENGQLERLTRQNHRQATAIKRLKRQAAAFEVRANRHFRELAAVREKALLDEAAAHERGQQCGQRSQENYLRCLQLSDRVVELTNKIGAIRQQKDAEIALLKKRHATREKMRESALKRWKKHRRQPSNA